MPSAPSNDELEGELVNPLEEDIAPLRGDDAAVVFDNQVNEQLKGKTLVQLKCAKASADNVSKQVGECIQEIEQGGVIFEEPLGHQFKRIFGMEMPSSRMSVEQYYEIVVPVLKIMSRDNQTFFYEHYGGLVPQEYKSKYYF